MAKKKADQLLKWNPYFLWRVLRTIPEYKIAVNDFLVSAQKANDSASLKFYEHLQVEDGVDISDENGNPIGRHETSPEEFLSVLEVYAGATSDEIEDVIYGSAADCFGIDPSRPHFQDFLNLFGDVVRFPIPFTLKNPAPEFLNNLWTLKPATLLGSINAATAERERSQFVSSDVVQDGKYVFDDVDSSLERVEILNVQVNWNFSEDEIVDSFARTLREHSDLSSKVKFKKRVRGQNVTQVGLTGINPNWKTLLKYLEIWDLHVDDVGHREKGRRVYSNNSALVEAGIHKKSKTEDIDQSVYDRTHIELARTAIRYIENICPFFVRSKHRDLIKKAVGD